LTLTIKKRRVERGDKYQLLQLAEYVS